MSRRLTIGRLSFFWWGTFWRGWLQFGRGFTVCADKAPDIQTSWTFLLGPVEIDWWSRADWRDFCFTPAEAAAEDERDRASLRRGAGRGE
jgi:hypothetical protein